MTKFLISFDEGSMVFPDEDLPAVSEAAHAVVREAKEAGVWVFGGGVDYGEQTSVVATDGTITKGRFAAGKEGIGGVTIIEVPSLDDALKWAAKIAVACRCAQDVRPFMYDPES